MASLVMMVGGAIVNGLAFSGSNFLFSKLQSHEEVKRHNKAMEQLEAAQDTYERQRIQQLDFINEKLREQGHAAHTFKDVDSAIREYNIVTNQTLPFSSPPKFSDFYQPTEKQKTEEIAFIVVGMTIVYFVAQRFK